MFSSCIANRSKILLVLAAALPFKNILLFYDHPLPACCIGRAGLFLWRRNQHSAESSKQHLDVLREEQTLRSFVLLNLIFMFVRYLAYRFCIICNCFNAILCSYISTESLHSAVFLLSMGFRMLCFKVLCTWLKYCGLKES